MNITVTKNQVSVNTDYILNDKEYNVNQCYFTFSDEYTDDLVKKAIFVQGTSTIEMSIINNQCQIPAEVLNNGQFELRVYAYEVDGEELLLRYSPSYTTAYVRTGSYIENAESPEIITPTQFEQYMQAMNDGLNEVANVNIDAEQLDNGMSVTITNRDGEDKTVYAYDGEKGETGATPNLTIGTVETGTSSSATITGTPENPVLNLVLEKGEKGETGATGNGIANFEKTSTSGLTDTYTITFTNGTTSILTVTNGKGITNIIKTSTSELTDTYTITYNDNTTSTFYVTNGRGIVSIDLTSTEENIDTYTIIYNDNTTSTFIVTNSTVTDQEFKALEAEVNKYKTLSLLLPKVEGEGNPVILNNTVDGVTMDIIPEGTTSQDGTPTPDTPIPIKVVTGDQNINISSKNLLNPSLLEQGSFNYNTGNSTTSSSIIRTTIFPIKPQTTYTISSLKALGEFCVYFYEIDGETGISGLNVISTTTIKKINFTTPNNAYYMKLRLGASTVVYNVNDDNNIQLEEGTTATTYTPYYNKDYELSLGTLELAQREDYKDYIYGTPNNWYKGKKVQKLVLNSENYTFYRNTISIDGETHSQFYTNISYSPFANAEVICNYFSRSNVITINNFYYGVGGKNVVFVSPKVNGEYIDTLTAWRSWIDSINLEVYGPVAQEVNEQITDTTLITQLNNLYNAISQEETTYITCSSASDDNETLQVKVIAYKDISTILNPTESEE